MKEADIAGLIEQFKSIGQMTVNLSKACSAGNLLDYRSEFNALVEEYEDSRRHFDKIKGDSKIDLKIIYSINMDSELRKVLIQMPIECNKALGVLNKLASPALTPDEIDKLNSLRQELEKISIDVNYEKNLEEAIKEHEQGHYLASALISSQVIIYSLDKIPGGTDEEKLEFLKSNKKIGAGRKDEESQFLKASRIARNFFSHRIDTFPSPEEALSLLSDCVRIVKLVF